MENSTIEKEIRFLITLKNLSTESLMEAYVKSGKLPKEFDIAKAIETMNRIFDAEIEYASENPDDYLDIYG